MSYSEEEEKIISREIKKFVEKKIEARKISKELIQIKKNIIFLKHKYGNKGTEEFNSYRGKLVLKKYKSIFSSKLKKEFNELSNEDKKKLYKSGLLTIYFRLNFRKYEKLKTDQNKKTELDSYVIERKNIQPYYWNLLLNSKTLDELKQFEESIKNNLDLEKISKKEEEENRIDKEMYEEGIVEEEDVEDFDAVEEEEYYREILDEISPDPVFMLDDDPADIQDSVEYQERGFTDDRDLFEDEENVDIDKKY